MHWVRLKNDSGAVALIVTLLVSSSFIFSLFVLVVDSGSLYSERRVIQNASDSATLALVRECALAGNGQIYGSTPGYAAPVCESNSNALDFSTKYANLNSPDGLTEVTSICGKYPLNTCTQNSTGIFDCKSVDAKYVNYVRVRTKTKTVSGNSISNIFSKILNQSDQGTTVPGCAQSAWGKANFAPIFFPVALPICNYQINGSKILKDFSSNNPIVVTGCSVVDLEGVTFNYISPTEGFSLLSNYGCPGISPVKKTFVGDIINIESSLQQVEQQCIGGSNQFFSQVETFVGSTFFLPVVTSVICQNSTTNCQGAYQFQVASFFAFKLLGLKFKNSGVVGNPPVCPLGETCNQSTDFWPSYCNATRNCIFGTFSRATVPGADISTDPNFPAVGAQAVQLLP